MDRVGVRELRAHLSSWLDRARKGEEILITERGLPIARLLPLDFSEIRKQLREDAVITAAGRPSRKIKKSDLGKAKSNVSELVKDQRR